MIMTQKQNGLAYSYIRFSSKKQEQGDSVRRQSEMAERYAADNNLRLSDKNFQDLGISAFKEGNRPSLADLLSAIEEGSIETGSTIIIESLDRLSRRGIDVTQKIIKSILQHGVFIASLVDGLLLNRDSVNDLVAVIRIALAADLAHKESEKKSQRLRATKGQQRRAALEGKAINKILPFWLSRDDSGYCFSERLETVKRIVTLKQQGHGSNKIAQILNKDGVKPLRSKEWNHTTVIKTIRNPTLYGAYQTTETTKERKVIKLDLVENYYPAVISKEEWMLLQSDQNNEKKGYKSTQNAYTGLLKCSCGGALSRQNQSYKGKSYSYHICTNRRDGRKCELTKSVKNLEEALTHILKKLEIKKTKKLDNSLITERAQTKTRIDELNEMLVSVAKVPMSVITTIGNLEEKLQELDKEISQHNALERSESAVQIDRLSSIEDPVELNMLLKRVIREITVKESGKGWFISVRYLNGHSQKFLWVNNEIKFFSDTKKFLRYLESIAETE